MSPPLMLNPSSRSLRWREKSPLAIPPVFCQPALGEPPEAPDAVDVAAGVAPLHELVLTAPRVVVVAVAPVDGAVVGGEAVGVHGRALRDPAPMARADVFPETPGTTWAQTLPPRLRGPNTAETGRLGGGRGRRVGAERPREPPELALREVGFCDVLILRSVSAGHGLILGL